MDANLKEEWSKDTLGSFAQYPDKKSPFKLYLFPSLLDNDVVSQLRNDINSSIKLKNKDNDLYKFKQSKDFKTEIPSKKLSSALHDFIDLMLGSVKEHLEKKTGKVLSGKNFDITASRYDVGDYLLCHNDDIKDELKKHNRSFAFIYYLTTRPWEVEDGGALTLYDCDSSGEPISINNRIMPRSNMLIIFPTSHTSWHSVQEVFTKNDSRLSINGWFHSDIKEKMKEEPSHKIVELYPHEFHRPIALDDRIEKFFKECVNQEYLMEKTCFMIRKRFKKESEINLTDFLVKEKFLEISEAFKQATGDEDNLIHMGPYNKRNYRTLKVDKLPSICKDLYDAFRSELFFMLLSSLTGLDLQPPSLKLHETEEAQEGGDAIGEDDGSFDEDDDDDDDSDQDSDDYDEDEDVDEESYGDDGEDEGEGGEVDGKEDKCTLEKVTSEDVENKAKKFKSSETIQSSSNEFSDKLSEKKEQYDDRKGVEEALPKKLKEEMCKLPRKRKKNLDPIARFEFRHFEHGSYTLIHDHAYELSEKSALDVILHFNHDFQVEFNEGGYISYLDVASDNDPHDSNYELLTIEPKSNCLSLVYRCDEGTCRFLKHINKSHKGNYQDLSCVYYEKPADTAHCGKESDLGAGSSKN